jgi:hypothetical protein
MHGGDHPVHPVLLGEVFGQLAGQVGMPHQQVLPAGCAALLDGHKVGAEDLAQAVCPRGGSAFVGGHRFSPRSSSRDVSSFPG